MSKNCEPIGLLARPTKNCGSATAVTACGAIVKKSRRELVEPLRVVAEDLLLLRVRQILAAAQLVERMRIAAVPMRIVGGVDDLLFADEFERLRQQTLVGFAGEIDPA